MGSYDVRAIIRAVVDDGDLLELRPQFAPSLVTALGSIGGRPVGIVANQSQSMAGTLDIAASQKGARFVGFCDNFGLPLITFVDTPGFLPGKDLEWRGMIRHGAQLAFAYAEATVPRVCVVLRKAYGGAYIVMDSRRIGNDLCVAWPSAEVAVMGAGGAVQILYRDVDDATREARQVEYEDAVVNPWVAAERGLVDEVIDPADTRTILAGALDHLAERRERLSGRKHSNTPL
jgi:acetyl-CoA carboxylase carboxyltransferase component